MCPLFFALQKIWQPCTTETIFFMCTSSERSVNYATKMAHMLLTSIMGGSPGDISENPVTWEKRKKGWRMSRDVGEATEGLENEL